MEKQKRWQLFTIIFVILLTIYNILPTVFYYSGNLKDPINEKTAYRISEDIIQRINDLETFSVEWLEAFCKHLNVKAKSISLLQSDPRLLKAVFFDKDEMEVFKKFFSKAGELISFPPARLQISSFQPEENDENAVFIERQIDVRIHPNEAKSYFTFSPKKNERGEIENFYRELVYDRVAQIGVSLGGVSPQAKELQSILLSPSDRYNEEKLMQIVREADDYQKLFAAQNSIIKRYHAMLARGLYSETKASANQLVHFLEKTREKARDKKASLLKEKKKDYEGKPVFDISEEMEVEDLEDQIKTLNGVILAIKEDRTLLENVAPPLNSSSLKDLLRREYNPNTSFQYLRLNERHPFIKEILIDWENEKICLHLYPEVQKLRENASPSENESYVKERLEQFIVNEIARSSKLSGESINSEKSIFIISLNELSNSKSLLALNLSTLAKERCGSLIQKLSKNWNPLHQDLEKNVYPIHDFGRYKNLSSEEQSLGLIVYAPNMHLDEQEKAEFKCDAIYVIAKGLNNILQKYETHPESKEAKVFAKDFNKLREILLAEGFTSYPGSLYGTSSKYSNDFIFELSGYYKNILKASRENFSVRGNKLYAVLEFTDKEQRLLTNNRIEKEAHEDLMKWRDEYHAAQVSLDLTKKYLVPPPSRSILWNNLKLSAKKYFRGDENKILKWGLDLSGGKMIHIGLRDQNNLPVTDEASLKQGVNELTERVNKMGLSEVNVRVEGSNIVLDFPGSQGFSASELIKASSMYFHVVNEKFSPRHSVLANSVEHFLQDVWNEALVTNSKDLESVNAIAWQQLGGDGEGAYSRPRSRHAKILYDNGLRLANPKNAPRNNAFNDTLSSIAMYKEDNSSEWRGQSTPLILIFHNYVIEGSDLENIQAGYDPEKGNILSFGVKNSFSKKKEQTFLSPRESLYSWTSQFSQEKIAGTSKEEFSKGSGWRMAVILNGYSISEPTLNQPLRSQAMIYGKFSQREVNKLVADLKAGSLSFSPQILSEQNISPDLGKEERIRGIFSAIIGFFLVIASMLFYYKFGGLVASVAVFFNFLIMWGVLQNLNAALTLAGIAGVILTVGMAVDANVLIFERIREEFSHSGRIASAIQTGYRKAFSAIIDSNVTTIIAALILMQFDSGPIKGFAVTLIIGIASSMFTALFVTRYFFTGWVKNPKNKELKMANFITKSNFDFLGKARTAFLVSLLIILFGNYFLFSQQKTILGMDFTGGYALNINIEETPEKDYKQRAVQALLNKGAEEGDFQFRELNKPNCLRLQIGSSMEEKGHPFYAMSNERIDGGFSYEYQKNPRIVWVVDSLKSAGMEIEQERLKDLDKNWTSVSGQFSDIMRQNALIGLGIALLCILIYITLRFEFKYAISSVIGIGHDVLISLGTLALLHKLGMPIQINMETIAAFMTIIGYSLNDTIIVFDRIREDVQIMRKKSFAEVVNHSLNVTLSRTILTSGTTLLALLALVLFGGSLIFDFAMVMTIGVVLGTISSWFIASPILLYFHDREAQKLKYELEKS